MPSKPPTEKQIDSSLAISTAALSKHYGCVAALNGVDLEVRRGELFGFLGPNGAGKTTTIRLLTGFLKPTAGTALVLGLDAWADSVAIHRHVGFLPDNSGLYDSMSGYEVLDYLGRLARDISPEVRSRLCTRLELADAALRRKVKGYSRGMRQKLAIIQALQHEPELVIMDEPAEGLDPLMQQALFDLLREVHRRGGTVFFSSHQIPEVEQLCHRVAIIRQGTLVTVSEVRDLRRQKVRRMEIEFRGPPPENLDAPGVEVLERNGPRWKLAVRGDINALLRALGRYDLADLVFEQAHLEDIFLDYYRGGS